MRITRSALVARVAICLTAYASCAGAQENIGPTLNIEIIEGNAAVNNIKSRVARETIVEVTDENHKPVAGAIVTFTLPTSGPGGTFTGGSNFLTVTTDQSGRAVASGFHPNNQVGSYQIRVTATHKGRSATKSIAQSNILLAAAAAGGLFGMGMPATLGVVGALVAGAVVGIVKGTGGGSSNNSKTGKISVGAPTLP